MMGGRCANWLGDCFSQSLPDWLSAWLASWVFGVDGSVRVLGGRMIEEIGWLGGWVVSSFFAWLAGRLAS